jgi:CDP-glycerol glycerophosphotransferase
MMALRDLLKRHSKESKVFKITLVGVRTIIRIFQNILYLITILIPRDSRLWIFGAWNGSKFIDNPKYIFIYVSKNCQAVKPCWITNNKKLAEDLRSNGFKAEYKYGIKGFWIQLRAGVVIFTHSVEYDFFAPLIAARVKRIQTWHGMPIKKIGYDDKRRHWSPRLYARLLTLLFPFRTDRLDLAIAGGNSDKKIYESAFNIKPKSVVITGYPRNDEIVRRIKNNINKKNEAFKVIYMPTFRGKPGSEFKLFKDTGFNFGEIDELCEKIGIEFWIKLHPVQIIAEEDLKKIKKCKKIKYYDEIKDIYEVIEEYKILVTDFSGIYFDYMITGRPIIMAAFEMENYLKNDRELYYEYDELCPSPPCSNWKEIFEQIENFVNLNNNYLNDRYMELQKKFHRYLDDKSSERSYIEIEKIIRN